MFSEEEIASYLAMTEGRKEVVSEEEIASFLAMTEGRKEVVSVQILSGP